jgi:hypothetical protein
MVHVNNATAADGAMVGVRGLGLLTPAIMSLQLTASFAHVAARPANT